jgi:hypothetical protein
MREKCVIDNFPKVVSVFIILKIFVLIYSFAQIEGGAQACFYNSRHV